MGIVQTNHNAVSAFLRRQVDEHPTLPQIAFDLCIGAILPVQCFALFPIVLRAQGLGGGNFPAGAMIAVGIAIVSLVVWLLTRWPPSLLAGSMIGGSILAFLFGVCLLPLSVLGIFLFGLGFLGFIPFVTSFVFFRNAVRASRRALRTTPRWRFLVISVAGFIVFAALPSAAHIAIAKHLSKAMRMLTSDDAIDFANGEATLRQFAWAIDPGELVRLYQNETNESKRDRLEEIYKELTGNEIHEIFDD